MLRTCTKCKESKPIVDFNTYIYKGGLKPRACCIKCTRLANKAYMSNNKKTTRNASLKRCYGLTNLEYENMFHGQEGKCKVCGRKRYKNGYLYVDHCHKTGRVRGLLCSLCNSAIGMLDDNVALLTKAIEYLQGS